LFERRDDFGGLRILSSDVALVQTVAQNKERYTKQELEKADLARTIIQRAAFPSDKGMAAMLNEGNLINSPITSSDVHRATKIDGANVPAHIGKATQRTTASIPVEPSPIVIDRDISVSVDNFFVDSE
jgi:hypothetical protein